MALGIFPTSSTLPGIGWGITRTPTTNTRSLRASSGVQYLAQMWQYPIRKWTIPIKALRQFASFTEWAQLEGFILDQAGMFNQWLYSDTYTPDYSVTNQALGVGTGTQTAFPLVRTFGGFTEPIQYVNTVSSVSVNGTPTSSYTLTQSGYFGPDTITFNSAPALNAAITATFTYYFVCHFLADDPEFNNFIGGRSSVDKLEFESLK